MIMAKLTRICTYVLSSILPVSVLALAPFAPQKPFLSSQHENHINLTTHSQQTWSLPSLANTSFHATYHPLNETDAFLTSLANAYPSNIVLETVGLSAEGRTILAAAITRPRLKKRKDGLKKKLRFVIIGTQHAREWIATSTALYLAHALVADPQEHWSITGLLDSFDFYIVPTPNPDGYEYTWDVDRFWYKNRMPVGHPECHGIDMNRNWGFSWAPSSSPNQGPCDSWYPGTRPFQAPEVQALANYFEGLEDIQAFIDLRSYGQMVSTPYSYSCGVVPPDEEDMLEAAHGAAAALRLVHGTPAKAGMLCETLYPAPGNILDWMYVNRGVKYSYAVHLRDTGTYGYALPQDWIRPVGEETSALVSYIVEFMCQRRRGKKTECDF